jgi:glycosidase
VGNEYVDFSSTPFRYFSFSVPLALLSDARWNRYEGPNVADQEQDENSTLNFYRKILKLRKAEKDLLVSGLFELHDKENEKTMIFTKTALDKSRTALVVLNFSDEKQTFEVPSSLASCRQGGQARPLVAQQGREGERTRRV